MLLLLRKQKLKAEGEREKTPLEFLPKFTSPVFLPNYGRFGSYDVLKFNLDFTARFVHVN